MSCDKTLWYINNEIQNHMQAFLNNNDSIYCQQEVWNIPFCVDVILVAIAYHLTKLFTHQAYILILLTGVNIYQTMSFHFDVFLGEIFYTWNTPWLIYKFLFPRTPLLYLMIYEQMQ